MKEIMKFTWEEKDITPSIFVCKPFNENEEVTGSDAKWTFRIGYHGSDKNICLISMTDGLIVNSNSNKKQLAQHFNENGMIPITRKRLKKTLKFLKTQYLMDTSK